MPTRLPPIESKRLYQQISELLLRSIDDGTFAGGSYLPPERKLADQLKVIVGVAALLLAAFAGRWKLVDGAALRPPIEI